MQTIILFYGYLIAKISIICVALLQLALAPALDMFNEQCIWAEMPLSEFDGNLPNLGEEDPQGAVKFRQLRCFRPTNRHNHHENNIYVQK